MVTLLMAPFTPVRHRAGLAGPVRGDQRRAARLGAPGRLAARSTASLVDDELAEQMALVRRLVELGRGARAEGRVRTRQPLGRALVSAPGWAADARRAARPARRGAQRRLGGQPGRSATPTAATADELVQVVGQGELPRRSGRRFGKGTQPVAAAIAAADPVALTAALRADGAASVLVDGGGASRSARTTW